MTTNHHFYGGIVLDQSGKVVSKSLALPVPWYARMHTNRIEQIFEDGVRSMMPRLTQRQLGFAEGTEELKGSKTWFLANELSFACIITDSSWPQRGAYRLLLHILEDPRAAIESPEFLKTAASDDAILRVQEKLDSAKGSVRDAIAATLARGEKLEELIAKTADLSDSSIRFHRDAKRVNRCCLWR